MFDFPNTPTGGQTVTSPSGVTYQWNGTAWVQQAVAYLPLAGGTLTGALTLSGAGLTNLQPATVQQLNSGVASTLPLSGGTLTGPLILSANAAAPMQPVTLQQLQAGYLPFSGGTLTGPLVLSADPTANLNPVTLQYFNANIPAASNAAPTMAGTAAPGTATLWSRGDHVHPTDTSRAPLASPTFTGTPAAPTPTAGTNTTQLATTAFVATSFAPLTSAALAGTPTAPTAATATNSTQLATTAYVKNNLANYVPIAGGVTVTGNLDVVGPLRDTGGRFLSMSNNNPTVVSYDTRGYASGFYCRGTDGYLIFGDSDGSGNITTNRMWVDRSSNLSGPVNITATGSLYWANTMITGSGGSGKVFQFMNGYYFDFNTGTGTCEYVFNSGGYWVMRNDGLCYDAVGAVGGIGAYQNLSDPRAKRDITPAAAGLKEILALKPIRFTRIVKDLSDPKMEAPKAKPLGPELGFNALEVRAVLPEAVREVGIELPDGSGGLDSDNPSLAISESMITAVLVNAVKEIDSRLRKLEQ